MSATTSLASLLSVAQPPAQLPEGPAATQSDSATIAQGNDEKQRFSELLTATGNKAADTKAADVKADAKAERADTQNQQQSAQASDAVNAQNAAQNQDRESNAQAGENAQAKDDADAAAAAGDIQAAANDADADSDTTNDVMLAIVTAILTAETTVVAITATPEVQQAPLVPVADATATLGADTAAPVQLPPAVTQALSTLDAAVNEAAQTIAQLDGPVQGMDALLARLQQLQGKLETIGDTLTQRFGESPAFKDTLTHVSELTNKLQQLTATLTQTAQATDTTPPLQQFADLLQKEVSSTTAQVTTDTTAETKPADTTQTTAITKALATTADSTQTDSAVPLAAPKAETQTANNTAQQQPATTEVKTAAQADTDAQSDGDDSDTASALQTLTLQQNTAQRQDTPASSFTKLLQQSQAQTQPQHNVTEQMLAHIRSANSNGEHRFQIQLNPVELGKLEIHMSISHAGKVEVDITADSEKTVRMLREDARVLETTLRDAGLKPDSGSLNFHLRGEQQQAGNGQGQKNQDNSESYKQPVNALDEAVNAAPVQAYILQQSDGLDIRI